MIVVLDLARIHITHYCFINICILVNLIYINYLIHLNIYTISDTRLSNQIFEHFCTLMIFQIIKKDSVSIRKEDGSSNAIV